MDIKRSEIISNLRLDNQPQLFMRRLIKKSMIQALSENSVIFLIELTKYLTEGTQGRRSSFCFIPWGSVHHDKEVMAAETA